MLQRIPFGCQAAMLAGDARPAAAEAWPPAPPGRSACARRTLQLSARPRQPPGAAHRVVVPHRPRAGPGPRAPRLASRSPFFRSRVDATQRHAVSLCHAQLIFAHAALTDLEGRTLLARPAHRPRGLWVAGAEGATPTSRCATGRWCARRGRLPPTCPPADGFTLDLLFTPAPAGAAARARGLSRKGPEPAQASYYYSAPARRWGRLKLQAAP
jgi:hypothetical protein